MTATATGQGGTASPVARGLVALMALVSLSLVAAPSASAQVSGVSVGVAPAFSSPVPVGAQNQAALLNITNGSFGMATTEPVTITNIRINASCEAVAGGGELCPSYEARQFPSPILTVDPTGNGRAGTACAGIIFTASAPDAAGTVVFVPSSPVVLGPVAAGGPGTTCVIDFTFDVRQRPLDGSLIARASVEGRTAQLGPAITTGSSVVNVLEAPASVAVQAAPPVITEGMTFSGAATVTGVAGGPPLSGSVTFRLFTQPSDCSGPAAVTSSPVSLTPGPPGPGGAPSGTASSPFSGPLPGRYVVVATYDENSSDPNYLSATTSCDDPAAQVTVLLRPPVAINVTYDATPPTRPAPGGTFTYTVVVTNFTPDATVTITSLNDSVFGNIATRPGSTCGALIGTGLIPMATSVPCSFTADVSGEGGTTLTSVLTVTAADDDGRTASDTDDATVSITGVGPSRYVPLSPTRIEDTRTGTGGLSGPVGPGATVAVQVAGRGGVPDGASAVVVNVTVTQPTAEGYLTLYPDESPRPLAANVNFTPGKTVPNLAVVKLGAGGRVALFNSTGSTHVIFDVAGYFVEAAGNAGRYQPLVPARIVDTRFDFGGVRLGPGESIDVQVTGRGGAPATGVSAAVLNVAATGTTAESYLTVYPTGEPRPHAANLNFLAGDTVSNRTMSKVGAGGKVTIYNNAGLADVVVDIGGTYTDASVPGIQGAYTPLDPARILDTRDPGGPGPVPAGGTIEVQVTGRGGVPPTGVRAVVLNVAVTQPAGPGYLTLFPAGAARPLASDLNYAAGETRANLVVVQVGENGTVSLFTPMQAHVVVDVAGWFD